MKQNLKKVLQPVLITEKNNSHADEILHALPDPILTFDHEGRIHFANHAAQSFLGKSASQLQGQFIEAFLNDNSLAQDTLASSLKMGRSITLHDVQIWGQSMSSLHMTSYGEGGWLLVLRQDKVPVREDWVRKMKAAIKPAQHLARMLAHEIKNPLAGIQGAAQLLCKSDLRQDDQELADLIRHETARVLKLVEKVNIFDGATEGYGPLNIHEPLEQALRAASVGFASKIEFKPDFDPSLPSIHGHHDRLVQVFVNILKNAAEASSSKIKVRTYFKTDAAFHPESHTKLPICIDIEDNGSGMDEKTRARLFEPYFTTRGQGEGLGLAIVSKLVDDHAGIVDATSVPGRTLFTLSFPRGDQA